MFIYNVEYKCIYIIYTYTCTLYTMYIVKLTLETNLTTTTHILNHMSVFLLLNSNSLPIIFSYISYCDTR